MNTSFNTSDESTQKYQKCSLNSFRAQSYQDVKIFKILQENENVFKISQFTPYYLPEAIEEQQYESVLGKGGFATIYRSFNYTSDTACVLKIHNCCTETQLEEIINEYTIQRKLNQKFPHIFLEQYGQVFLKKEQLDYFSIYAQLELGITSLDKYIREAYPNTQEFQNIYHSILDQILKMHSIHIAHRDIKPHNIILTKRGWVLGDFGCAMIYQKTKGIYKIAGTKPYLPKYIRNKINNIHNDLDLELEMDLFNNDIYAFLITMLQIYKKGSAIEEFQNLIENQYTYNIKDSSFDYLFQIYQKPYSFIKQHISIGLNRIQINFKLPQQVENLSQSQKQNTKIIGYKLEKYMKQILFTEGFVQVDNNYRMNRLQKEEIIKYCELGRELYEEEKIEIENFIKYVEIMFEIQDNWENNELFSINENTKIWQYLAIQEYYKQLLNMNLRLQVCQNYQKYADSKYLAELKFYEIDLLMYMGQDQLASAKIEEMEQQFFLDEISLFKLKCYKLIQNSIWFEEASSLMPLLKLFFESYYNLHFLQQNICDLFWLYGKVLFENPEPLSLFYNNQFFKLSTGKQLTIANFIEIALAKGADCFGICLFLNTLTYQPIYHFKIGQLLELYQYMISYFEKNPKTKMYFWKVLLNFSRIYYQFQEYELSMHYANKSLSKISKENYIQKILANIQIFCSLIKLRQYEKAKNVLYSTISKIENHYSSNLTIHFLHFLVNLVNGFDILILEQNFVEINLFYKTLKSAFNQTIDKNILNFLFRLEWETITSNLNIKRMQQYQNSEVLKQFQNGTINDIEVLSTYQNLEVISHNKAKKSNNFQLLIKPAAKYMQNLIIYQDLYCFPKTPDIFKEITIYYSTQPIKKIIAKMKLHLEKNLYQF